MSYKTEALLFISVRAQLIHEKIFHALKDNFIIICDRFMDSSIAYRGTIRNLALIL